jgi:fatty acid desaturase
MTTSEKKRMLTWNTLLWIAAMILPAVFKIAFESTKFPWIVILPCLFFGFLLASNNMLSRAIGEPVNDSATEK